ncbi:MAG TPA: serine protease [Aliidongia sp.]|uniref:serine protease n=1 Tax=Aliidongia sp. TaxID=1914230 RepID=UPI002DDCD971|nr:serine protease [Aliidongia sp.]HEV2674524.1 serine protease [Aliidongia sp.]
MKRFAPFAATVLLAACDGASPDWTAFSGPWPAPGMVATNGTGVIVADGLVLTAGHVVRGCKVIRLAAASDRFRAVPARIKASGPSHGALELDVALLEAAPLIGAPWPPARFSDLWPDDAEIAGVPYGRGGEVETSGAVTLLGYPDGTMAPHPAASPIAHLVASRPDDVLQFHLWDFLGDAAPGFSGGPIVDAHGAVLGIAFKGRPAHDPELVLLGIPEGLGLAVSSRDLIAFLNQNGVETLGMPTRPIADSLVQVFCFR